MVGKIVTITRNNNSLTGSVSASENIEEVLPNESSWRSEDTVRFAGILADHGVDVLDVSSGGLHNKQKIFHGPGYQAHFSEAVKKAHGNRILVTAVGGVSDGNVAQAILDKEQADAIFVGRYFQKNPGAVWKFADDLGVAIKNSHQSEVGYRGHPGKEKVTRQ